MRWVVEHVHARLWIAYRSDLERAMIFRTWRHAMRYANQGGAL